MAARVRRRGLTISYNAGIGYHHGEATTVQHVFRLGIVRKVVRNSGLGHACAVFVVTFAVCSALVWLLDPCVSSLADALWVCFQTVTTIGFGDIAITTAPARIIVVVLSVVSVFFLAVITAALVNYTNESMKAQRNESVALFLDQIEHLEDLSPEELRALSQRVRDLDARR